MQNIKKSSNLIQLIYALEPLCYYFGMKPREFWDCTYTEIDQFTQANLCRLIDDYRREIQLQEAVTSKLIQADAMSNKRPKIVSVQKMFANLFPKKEEKAQTPKEIADIMRALMKQKENA